MSKYPVIVETRERHVVWEEADSLQEAVDRLTKREEIYEDLSASSLLENGCDLYVEAPSDWEWDDLVEQHPEAAALRPAEGGSDTAGTWRTP
ncbi:hypothetical protein ACIPY6_28445 [Streptomyces sp. NPDC090054]|uniref:hypothetical protein n=1 Tax=Streptomyces sp. NPDC090054 TaxID=3365933 RepID=UPI003818DE9E